MRRAAALIVLAVTLAALAAPGTPHAGDGAGDPVLRRFLGAWKTEALIRHVGPPARELTTRGQATGRPGPDGGRVEFRTTSLDPPGLSELQVMTYDAEAGVYRQSVSDSSAYRHEAVGRWNAVTATLRWEGAADGTAFVIEDRWVTPDRLEWTLIRTSAEGRLLQTIDGVVSRQGEDAPRDR